MNFVEALRGKHFTKKAAAEQPHESIDATENRAPRTFQPRTTFFRVFTCAVVLILAYGCSTTTPPPSRQDLEPLRGIASWYGEEFAGRTTANGEIFDPGQYTAAHRTLPFGTILQVTNPETRQSVRVRVNDRGPYIGGRVIDLSYAAAKQIGLIEPGLGEVEIKVISMGNERMPPQPFGAPVADAPESVPVIPASQPAPAPAPPVQPAPQPAPLEPEPQATMPAEPATPIEPAPVVNEPVVHEEPVAAEPATLEHVAVETQHDDVPTRKQVASDGKTIEDVPVEPAAKKAPARKPAAQPPARRTTPQYIVQVGAFSIRANADALLERLTAIGQRAYVDKTSLYRVRIGPFATRDQAVAVRARLESQGLSAFIVAE